MDMNPYKPPESDCRPPSRVGESWTKSWFEMATACSLLWLGFSWISANFLSPICDSLGGQFSVGFLALSGVGGAVLMLTWIAALMYLFRNFHG